MHETLKRFARLTEINRRRWDRDSARREALQREFEAEVVKRFRAKHKPRGKVTADLVKKRDLTLYQTTLGEFQVRAEAMVKRQARWRDWFAEKVKAAGAAAVVAPSSGVWSVFRTVSDNEYRSQPAARKYARVDAELRAADLKALGFEAHIAERVQQWEGRDWRGRSFPMSMTDFVVWTNADPVTVEALHHKDGMTLRDAVKFCWKNGANARVIFPMLPEGYEEKVGIDYFGNDVSKRRTA